MSLLANLVSLRLAWPRSRALDTGGKAEVFEAVVPVPVAVAADDDDPAVVEDVLVLDGFVEVAEGCSLLLYLK
jgi:hypothetical protein